MNYYHVRNSVNDNNNNGKGFLSFEEKFLHNDWNLMQFGCFVSTFQINSHLRSANFSLSEEEKKLSKAENVRGLAKELIDNEE